MKSYDCVFVYFNVVNGIMTGAEYQIHSAYIRCYLERQNYSTIQYINQSSKIYNEYLSDLCYLDTTNYIFYINEYNFYITKIIINRLKKTLSERNVFILGPSAKYIADFLSNDVKYDVCLLKHEHYALQEILRGKVDKQYIYNIYYRNQEEVIPTKDKDYNYSLDDLGLPYSQGFIPVEAASGVGMLTSEGCFGNCVFCSYKSKDCKYRVHEIDSVIEELDCISSYGGGKQFDIRFLDDCFSISQERTLKLLEAMQERNYNFKFWCCIRADILSDKILKLMSELNYKSIVIGLETASLSVLERIGKVQEPYSAEQYINMIEENYKKALEININPVLSINFGLPNELWEDAMQTIEFITDLHAEKNVSICFMTCFPGSKVFANSDWYNVLKENSPTGLPFRTIHNNYSMQAVFNRLYDYNIIKKNVDYRIAEVIRKYTTLLTGIYSNEKLEPIFETVSVDKINKDNIEFLDRYLELNGTIIFNCTNLVMSRQYYCDNRKQLKIKMKNFDRNLKLAYNADFYVPNQDSIRISDNFIIIQHNNEYMKDFIKVPIKKIKIWEDINFFIKEADRFFENHLIDLSNFERFNVLNICRYSGFCGLNQLRSIKIFDKNICASCTGNKIGTIYNNYSTLLENVKKLRETKYNIRKCSTCDIRKWCSRCLFPDMMEIPYLSYCDLILKNQKLVVYLKIIFQLKNTLLNIIESNNSKLKVYFPRTKEYINTNFVKYQINDEICLVKNKSKFYLLHLFDSGFRKCGYDDGKAIEELFLTLDEKLMMKDKENLIPKLIEYGILKL